VGATLAAGFVVLATAAAVVAYYVIEPFQPTVGDPDVTATFQDYFEAVADGDGDTACGLLTEDAQSEILEEVGGGDCEEAVEQAEEELNDDQKDELRDIEPEEVDVDGDRATISVEGADGEVELEREDGEWRISDLG
jgi:hypothetical protein